MIDVTAASIESLQKDMQQNRLTSYELVAAFAERVAAHDKLGAGVNAVAEWNPDAFSIAAALDGERQRTGARGPLHGIPILIKDNVDTADHMHTSAGSLALAESYALEDAEVARRLRAAGAVLLGKTKMTEWANFMAEGMPSGYSSRGGQVNNPYGPGAFDVGGSSSGSGAAIAAGFAVAAIGTETSGSILSPSSENMLVGIKPTVGLVSRYGIIPIAYSQDTAGPMAKTVADAALLLQAIVGYDPRDPATGAAGATPDYRMCLLERGLEGVRLGVPRAGYYEHLSAEQAAVMERAIEDVRRLGAVVIDPIELSAKRENGYEVLLYEFKSALNSYLRKVDPRLPVHSLKELIAFNDADKERMLRYGQAILLASEETSGSLTDPDYLKARLRDLRYAREEGIDHVLREHALDALLFPANYGAAIAAKAGYPSITVPGGKLENGCPFGVTFTSTAFTEAKLIRMAYAYEQGTMHRVAPDLT
ncbi:amidase family protein [Ferroacidibacillus organovorans]|uniref:Amidase n=1 Tax=Ferroacidibacillus organovorans TaxID=1765683 RepID=A0A1V4ESL5_9BACL|nr:amidase family protein [Ferroacidibacillus organovorans]OPG15852.1 amidase [Ferroacidibacillus organovorans]